LTILQGLCNSRANAAADRLGMRTHRRHLTLASIAAVALLGCGQAKKAEQPRATSASSNVTVAVPHPKSVPGADDASLRAARPTRSEETILFQPKFRLRLPAHWTANDIDEGAFTAMVGTDERKSPGALTLDGALEHRSLDVALRRLRQAKGLHAGPVRTYRVGRAHLEGFDAGPFTKEVTFNDSGFHPQPGDQLRTMVMPLHGRTVTVFVIANHRHFSAFAAAAQRVLATVR
jgi:hypothetical protein